MNICGAVLARNGGPLLAEAVGDLLAALGAERVVVIDNASTDGAADDLPVETIRLPENMGFTGGANRALQWARSRGASALLLLNQDARLDTASIRRMIDLLATESRAGAVFAKIVQARRPYLLDGLSGRRNLRHKLTTGLGAGRIDRGRPRLPCVVQHGHGAALLLATAAAAAVGDFDERLFAYHEEVDLCWRLSRAGYRVLLEPRAVARHRGPDDDPRRRRAKAYLLGRNSLLVAAGNGGRLARWRVAGWVLAATLLYYGPLALAGDVEARALLTGWRDGWRNADVRPAIRHLL